MLDFIRGPKSSYSTYILYGSLWNYLTFDWGWNLYNYGAY